MNHFKFGFFDELEKIATDKDLVGYYKQYFKDQYPGMASGAIGELATRHAQGENMTRGRLETPTTDPRFHSNNFRFDVSIPKPGQPGARIVANRDQRTKFLNRTRNLRTTSFDYMTAPSRAKYGVQPVGLR